MPLSVPICQDGTLQAVGNSIECVGGTWLAYDGSVLPGAFDLASLDPARLAGFFGAGFVLVGTLLVAGIAIKFVLDVLRR